MSPRSWAMDIPLVQLIRPWMPVRFTPETAPRWRTTKRTQFTTKMPKMKKYRRRGWKARTKTRRNTKKEAKNIRRSIMMLKQKQIKPIPKRINHKIRETSRIRWPPVNPRQQLKMLMNSRKRETMKSLLHKRKSKIQYPSNTIQRFAQMMPRRKRWRTNYWMQCSTRTPRISICRISFTNKSRKSKQ